MHYFLLIDGKWCHDVPSLLSTCCTTWTIIFGVSYCWTGFSSRMWDWNMGLEHGMVTMWPIVYFSKLPTSYIIIANLYTMVVSSVLYEITRQKLTIRNGSITKDRVSIDLYFCCAHLHWPRPRGCSGIFTLFVALSKIALMHPAAAFWQSFAETYTSGGNIKDCSWPQVQVV